jgi:hypothetical protein
MNRSQFMTAAVAAVVTLAMAPTVAFSGTSDSEVPTFREYQQQAFKDTDAQWVVNGDEPVLNIGQLRDYYDTMTSTKQQKTHEDGLIVNKVNGVADKWSASQALNLTYCVSTKFGTRYSQIVTAMSQGAALWEGATSKVNFVYVPSADSNCTVRNNAVLFSVEPTSTTQYIARAFFPSSPDRSRNILVNAASLANSGNWEPGDIIAHELGHTLGFRHEHTRPEAGTCFEDNNWIPLTPYDNKSIMHYPQCNGGSSDLEFQPSDADGVRALYGA